MNVTIMNLSEFMDLFDKLVEEDMEVKEVKSEFKVGQKVKIRGSYLDCTEGLDGKIGTIIEVSSKDCLVRVPNNSLTWWVWNENMEVVENA